MQKPHKHHKIAHAEKSVHGNPDLIHKNLLVGGSHDP